MERSGVGLLGLEGEPTEGFEFGLLHPTVVMMHWNDLVKIMEEHPARAGGELFATVDHIKQSVLNMSVFVWGGFLDNKLELIVLCCFKAYPITRTMEVIYVGGKGLKRAFEFWPKMEAWAAKCGATHIEARLSPAMIRFYKKMNVKPTAYYYRKPLVQFSN